MNEYTIYILLILFFIWIFWVAANKFAHAAIFFPTQNWVSTPEKQELEYEEIELTTKDRRKIHGWFIPHEKPLATLLFFHGNTGNISHRVNELKLWNHIKLSVLLIDYRGYGKSMGKPTEKGLHLDAEAAYKYLTEEKQIPPQKIICFGRSIGGAVAIRLASYHKIGALIIASTFTNINDLVRILFPKWVAPFLVWVNPVRLPSQKRISTINCPCLIIHGENDEFIPWTMGKKLYEEALNPKMWYLVEKAKHNDTFIIGGKKYWYLVQAFIEKIVNNPDLGKNN